MNYSVTVGSDLIIGNAELCNRTALGFDAYNIIHIWRDDKPENNCKCSKVLNNSNTTNHFFFNYKDGYDLFPDMLDTLAEFVNNKRKILVHCHAGKTRSPTVAIFIYSVMNKVHPIDAMYVVYKEYYKQSKELPNMTMLPLEGIVSWFESKYPNITIGT